MTNPKTREFINPAPHIVPGAAENFLEVSLINNLHNFVTHANYIAAFAESGKMSVDDAYKEVKKLYKAMKQSKKSLKGGWLDGIGI
jgi:hypothetical protein